MIRKDYRKCMLVLLHLITSPNRAWVIAPNLSFEPTFSPRTITNTHVTTLRGGITIILTKQKLPNLDSQLRNFTPLPLTSLQNPPELTQPSLHPKIHSLAYRTIHSQVFLLLHSQQKMSLKPNPPH